MENEVWTQLKNELTNYGKAMGEVGRFRLIGIVSRVLGLFLLIFTVVLLLFALLSFGAVALIDVMAKCMPVWAAALIIGAGYILLIIIAVACRKVLFIHPFIRLLTKQLRSEEELALKTIEAEHEAELQRVRLECHAENATREMNFYIGLLGRIKNWLFNRK